ncbi:MAG: winged helix DNA-binding protein, partial [Bacteroidota bacterium]
EHSHPNFEQFSIWLFKALDSDSTEGESADGQRLADRAHRTMHRIEKYVALYAKKVLRELPVSTMEDYYFLEAIDLLGSAPKSEVYNATVTETTTGAQILKRLQRLGLISERPDEVDRRVKLVTLTDEGRDVLEQGRAGFARVAQLRFGNMAASDRDTLSESLRYLEAFHSDIHSQHRSDETFEQLFARALPS